MKQLTILGTGPGNPELLTTAAATAISEATVLIGARRLLEELGYAEKSFAHVATRPPEIMDVLKGADWEKACVLMSGDIGIFSGAKNLLLILAEETDWEIVTIPGISSVQYFAAKIHRSWNDWHLLSAHGIDCDVASEVAEHPQVFLVTGGKNTVPVICQSLVDEGRGGLKVTVGEKLSYPDERIVSATAQELAQQTFDLLSVMLIEGNGEDKNWPYVSTGIPDDMFIRGQVPMTKQEVRACALAKLGVKRDDIVYDIGAGTGSVSVELALQADRGQVYAVERGDDGLELIRKNAAAFGCTNVHTIPGYAPEVLADLPAPDAVFIGGSGGKLGEILTVVLEKNPQVRVTIACITLETLAEALACLKDVAFTGLDVAQIAVSRGEVAGPYHLMKGMNPVFLISATGAGR